MKRPLNHGSRPHKKKRIKIISLERQHLQKCTGFGCCQRTNELDFIWDCHFQRGYFRPWTGEFNFGCVFTSTKTNIINYPISINKHISINNLHNMILAERIITAGKMVCGSRLFGYAVSSLPWSSLATNFWNWTSGIVHSEQSVSLRHFNAAVKLLFIRYDPGKDERREEATRRTVSVN